MVSRFKMTFFGRLSLATAAGGDPNKVYFTAGIGDEQHGLFGSLAPAVTDHPLT
jgi:hypothetical protein